MILLGLLIIAIGAFCQSSCYVPINKIKSWSWETYWIVQGLFAWIVLPLAGALLAIPHGETLTALFAAHTGSALRTMFFGVLWGIGGLTFGLSMRYLGVALGQSLSLGTCAALGTILGPVFIGQASSITSAVIWGVVVTLAGITVIGIAGNMKARTLAGKGGTDTAVKDFNFTKGITVALFAGLMSACFNIGLYQGADISFEGTDPLYASLPATFLVTLGGFLSNAVYCFAENTRNHTWNDYAKGSVWANNLMFCLLAGALWYSQFFGLAIGKGFLTDSPALQTFAFCILMALNVVFSNFWGIVLHEWKGCNRSTIAVLVSGLVILIVSSFIPQII